MKFRVHAQVSWDHLWIAIGLFLSFVVDDVGFKRTLDYVMLNFNMARIRIYVRHALGKLCFTSIVCDLVT